MTKEESRGYNAGTWIGIIGMGISSLLCAHGDGLITVIIVSVIYFSIAKMVYKSLFRKEVDEQDVTG